MNDEQSLTGRPELKPQLGQAQTGVFAHAYDYNAAAPANNDLEGLVRGLQAINPRLDQWLTDNRAEQRQETVKQYTADAYKEAHPRDALTGDATVSVPESVPPAMGPVYMEGFRRIRSQRAALETTANIQAQYEDQKDLPGFNAAQFMADQQRKALAGLRDPEQVAIMGQHLDELKARVLAEDGQRLVRQHEQERKVTMARITEDGLMPDQTPEEMANRARWVVDQGAAIQVAPQDSVRAVFSRLRSISDARNGDPTVFDVLDKQDPTTGLSLSNMAPDLAHEIEVARSHAATMRDNKVMEATEGDRYQVLVHLNNMVDTAPDKLTPEYASQFIGKFGLSAEKAASFVNQAHDRMVKQAQLNEAMQDFDKGMLGRQSTDVQEKVLEARLGPQINAAWSVFSGNTQVPPEQRQVVTQQLAESILQAHSSSGATVPVKALGRLVETLVTNMPSPDGPSPGFQAMAELHRALAANPQYRDMYFKEDTDGLLNTYNTLLDTQRLSRQDAYTRAYIANSPEERERMAKKVNDPKFLATVDETSSKAVEGSNMFRMWGLLNGRPQNADQVGAWASWRIKEFWKANPHLSEQDVVDKVQRMVRSEWVMDGISGQAVKVPPRFSGPNTQEAITDLTRAFMKTLDKQGNLSDGAYIKYRPMGDNGTYRVEVWNGSYMRGLHTVNLQQVLTDYNIKMNLQASEAQQMRNTLVKLRAGEAAPMLDPILIEKGVTTGFITSQDKALLNKQRLDSTFARLGSPPAVDLGTPNGNNTLEYARGGLKVDPKLTAQAAMDFAYKGTLGQPNHLDLASSLVTAREGVVLKSYSDPARGAGLNIGAGYNLKANAATVAQDLQSVGVPADRIEDIKAGRASLTPEQAKWLTSLTVKRFEGQVQKEANTAKPGLWDSMTPQQRAVMIDVAYQTGDSGQFKQAWKALAAGDKAAFGQQLRTYFTDQSGKRVEDTRALDLRSSMLLGPSAWRARLKVASSP